MKLRDGTLNRMSHEHLEDDLGLWRARVDMLRNEMSTLKGDSWLRAHFRNEVLIYGSCICTVRLYS